MTCENIWSFRGINWLSTQRIKQECIPVGCVPPTAVVVGGVWSPSISPLGVGLDLIPINFRLGCGPGAPPPDQTPHWEQAPPGAGNPPGSRHPPVNRMTDACENITLPQTSFAGGNKSIYPQEVSSRKLGIQTVPEDDCSLECKQQCMEMETNRWESKYVVQCVIEGAEFLQYL